MIVEPVTISEMARNALTELGNIGAGNATTALSVMLSSSLTICPPEVDVYGFDELDHIFGSPETTIVGVLSKLQGDVDAMILFVMSMYDAKNLVKTIIGDENIEWHSELGLDAVVEIGNVMIGSYVASLESLSGLKMRYSVPECSVDMAGAILSYPLAALSQVSDNALLINSKFQSGETQINGYIMMISEPRSYDVVLEKLGIGGTNG